jgi:uncharacterized Zn-binding protein involved in type VI secretion
VCIEFEVHRESVMPGNLILLGDKTSHGGTVIEASSESSIGGIRIARLGDNTACPLPGHGVNPIVSGDGTLLVDGKPVARMGDVTACGAVLIASQALTTDKI